MINGLDLWPTGHSYHLAKPNHPTLVFRTKYDEQYFILKRIWVGVPQGSAQ